jgi:enoyl-CoA hydratase/carnithine racemase
LDYSRYAKDHSLDVVVKDRVATITINRPEVKNAVDWRIHRGLEHLLIDLAHDGEVGAAVLTGAGDTFCAGGDLKNFSPPDSSVFDTVRNRNLNLAFAQCEVPIVAAVNGAALGLGATLALSCDVIYMADTAKLGDTHVKVGLTSGDGCQVMFPLLVGLHRAKEYLMTGKLLSGAEAERIGLVNHCVPRAEVVARATAFARELTEVAPMAVRFTKMALNKLVYQNLNLMLDFGLTSELVCSKSEDFEEGRKAFFEKRRPTYRGR